MADQLSPLTEDAAAETAEAAFRRIARRRLVERGCPADQLDTRTAELLRRGASLRIDVDDILKPR